MSDLSETIAWPPTGIPSPTAHQWKGDQYHCQTCFASGHCPQCSDKAGSQGHYMVDAEGGFFGCQEPERRQRWREEFLLAANKARRS